MPALALDVCMRIQRDDLTECATAVCSRLWGATLQQTALAPLCDAWVTLLSSTPQEM